PHPGPRSGSAPRATTHASRSLPRLGAAALVPGRLAVGLRIVRRTPERVVALLGTVDVAGLPVDDPPQVVERLGVVVVVAAVVLERAVPGPLGRLRLEAVGVEVARRRVDPEPTGGPAPPLVPEEG